MTKSKVLIANRGEIAVRIIQAARELGLKTVAVYSDADQGTKHVRLADECIALSGSRAVESYLNQEKLLTAARLSGAQAIHPGYGFLSENAEFAAAVESEGLRYVGPRSETVRIMGDKVQARKAAVKAGLPVVPGCEAADDIGEFRKFAKEQGYPLLVKAVAGGSGRGMRIVERPEDLETKIAEAQREAKAAFRNEHVFLERFVRRPRHIEVQIFGDGKGQAIHCFERECSLQRRQQKLVEEAPANRLHAQVRSRLHQAAVSLSSALCYRGAGTLEFLVEGGESADSPFYFLEMNTRIQVEHPVTEAVTGLDLVKMQLLLAMRDEAPWKQSEVSLRGHAIEFRVYAEDVEQGFCPCTGTIHYVAHASGPGVREDSWIESGSELSAFYDALLAKLTVWGASREEALQRARRVMDEYLVEGLPTTLDFHRWLLQQADFCEGKFDIHWIERTFTQATQTKTEPTLIGPLRVSARKTQTRKTKAGRRGGKTD